MNKITKKYFLELYKNNKLKLLQGGIPEKKEIIKKIVDKISYNQLLNQSIKTSNCNINNYNDNVVVNVYQDNNVIYVESKIDNSFDNQTSRNDIQYYNNVYILNNK